jgi:hypothetical protein
MLKKSVGSLFSRVRSTMANMINKCTGAGVVLRP